MTVVVSFSGGKDSTACLLLALEVVPREELRVVYQDTGFEHPAVYEYLSYIEQKCGIVVERAKSSVYEDVPDFCMKRETLPSFQSRGCTGELKQYPLRQYLIDQGLCKDTTEVWFGVRARESKKRSEKYGGLTPESLVPLSFMGSPYRLKVLRPVQARFPVVDWSEEQVFEAMRERGVEPNPLYGSGFRRVGCFPCVLSGAGTFRKVWATPEGKQNILRLIEVEEYVSIKKGRRTTFINGKTLAEVVGAEEEVTDENEPEIYCGFCHS